MATTLHVSPSGADLSPGTEEQPLRTINRAAQLARPGDTVLVHEGTYREWVAPLRGGTSATNRITYQPAPGAKVTIKGSERINTWENVEGTTWKVELPNSFFGDFNPYAEVVGGDWIVLPKRTDPPKHLGEVYLNGKSFYEVASVEEVQNPTRIDHARDGWTGVTVPMHDPDQTVFVWHAQVSETTTTIWANFHGANPNEELVEINVRRSVFYPKDHHVDYITVRGFELAQAASPWTPPTADQPGLIGPNWAKGWIIEDNDIHDAKCSAVSLGKERSTGHNLAEERGDKPGYQYQLESVFSARQIGWDKEHIGSHVVRRNTIHDNGQNGVVGHLGCVFSTIEDNHIYNIAIKREFYGHEIGGIKLHGAIDVSIARNHIHDCTLGTWLDWQTQGLRLTQNVYHSNNRDLFIEVSHGPYVVDHNVFASRASAEIQCQGGAIVNNLFAGTYAVKSIVERPTPYHLPHSTQVAGYAAILAGDDRVIGNIFLGGTSGADASEAYEHGAEQWVNPRYGTAIYDGSPVNIDEYIERVNDPDKGDHERFMDVKQPAYIRNNFYAGGAEAFEREEGAVVAGGGAASASVSFDGKHLALHTDLPAEFDSATVGLVVGTELPPVRFVGAFFENPDGSPVELNADLLGAEKTADTQYAVGPIVGLTSGKNTITLS